MCAVHTGFTDLTLISLPFIFLVPIKALPKVLTSLYISHIPFNSCLRRVMIPNFCHEKEDDSEI